MLYNIVKKGVYWLQVDLTSRTDFIKLFNDIMIKKKQKEFVVNFDYFLVEYKSMHSSHKKYLSPDSDTKAHTLEIWKQTMTSISDYCKKHNCLNEFKW